MILPGWGGGGAVMTRTPELSFLQLTKDGSNASSYSITSVNFGTAAADREIIIAVFWRGDGTTRTLNSATIGGVTATIHLQNADPDDTNPEHAALISARVPTGTSGTVALTMSGNCFGAGIATYRAQRLTSRTPHATDTDDNDILSFSIDVPHRGFVIAAGMFSATTAGTVTGATEDYDEQDADNVRRFLGGSASELDKETGRSVSVNGGSGNAAGVCASWI